MPISQGVGRRIIIRLLVVELSVLLLLSLGFYCHNAVAGYSALLGGLVIFIPNAYFAVYAFRYLGLPFATVIARSFYWGQAGKFALVATGFALVFQFVQPLDLAALFSVFIILLVLHIVCADKISRYLALHDTVQNP